MNRHELDAVSLTAGALFATIAVVSLLGRADVVDVQAKWLWPLVLIGLGLAGLMAALRPDRNDGRHPPVADPVVRDTVVGDTVVGDTVVTDTAMSEPVTVADSDGPVSP